jgi:hypothetical protein
MSSMSAAPLAEPKEASRRILQIIHERIAALRLDLSQANVVTEAATGAYACTAVIAALAGARRVHALARGNPRHGSAADAVGATNEVASLAGVEDRITFVEHVDSGILAACDILTNSGHLRPISRATIAQLPRTSVIALMFETWEFRDSDIDINSCRRRGIRIAGVNESHPDVAVFPFLGPLCVRLLLDAGMPPMEKRIAVICDNPFAPFIEAGLAAAGASVRVFPAVSGVSCETWDAVVIALNPAGPAAAGDFLRTLADRAPRALIAQFWGDVDRPTARALGFALCPPEEPAPGHMGILLNALGPEPIVRLQSGGLRAAELVWRGQVLAPDGIAQML